MNQSSQNQQNANQNINLNPVLISLNNIKKNFLFNQILLNKAYKLQNKKNHEDCLKILELVNNKMYDLGNFLDNLILTPVIIRDCREIISEKRRFLKRSIVKRLLNKDNSNALNLSNNDDRNANENNDNFQSNNIDLINNDNSNIKNNFNSNDTNK